MAQLSLERQPLSVERTRLTEGDLGLERVWSSFEKLSSIPRPSGKEAQAIGFIKEFAKERNIDFEEDNAGNILMIVPPTNGMDQVPGVVFQGHLDMVPQGEPDPGINGVVPYICSDTEGQMWVTAQNTTLGADNGIGVSLMLALADEQIPHGRLAFLFTNREEIGLESAREMSLTNRLDGFKFLFNLDSEEEGEATISSAGAADTYITYPVKNSDIEDKKLIDIKLEGLMGGHSGVVIAQGRLNAIKVATTTLTRLQEILGPTAFNIVSIESGTARNAIPNKAKVTLAVDPVVAEHIGLRLAEIRTEILANSTHEEEEGMVLEASPSTLDAHAMFDNESTTGLLRILRDLPDGLVKLSEEIEGFPETSTNIGIVKPADDGSGVSIQIMSRSSRTDQLEDIRGQIRDVAESYHAEVNQPAAFSGWPPILDSEINSITAQAWKSVSGKQIEYKYTHGGLECGVLLGKFPHLQAISIGPEILGAHTTEERVQVDSVKRYYKLLKEIVKRVSSI